MLLSLCTYSVIIKMIDRNLSEVIDPSHYYYLWDLVIINTIQNILSDKWKIFFRRKDKWKILNIQTEYQLCTKKRKEKKKLRILLCHGEGHFFFFFFGLSRDFYWRNKLRYRDSILQQNMNIFGKQNHLIWTNQMIKSRGVYQAT